MIEWKETSPEVPAPVRLEARIGAILMLVLSRQRRQRGTDWWMRVECTASAFTGVPATDEAPKGLLLAYAKRELKRALADLDAATEEKPTEE